MEKEDIPSPGRQSHRTGNLKPEDSVSALVDNTALKPEVSAYSRVSRATVHSSRKSGEKNYPLITALSEGSQRQESDGQNGTILQVNQVGIEVLRRSKYSTIPMKDYTAAKLSRVTNNIISALAAFLQDGNEKDKIKEKVSKAIWKSLINSDFNHNLLTDGFWLIVLKKNEEKFAKENSKVDPFHT